MGAIESITFPPCCEGTRSNDGRYKWVRTALGENGSPLGRGWASALLELAQRWTSGPYGFFHPQERPQPSAFSGWSVCVSPFVKKTAWRVYIFLLSNLVNFSIISKAGAIIGL